MVQQPFSKRHNYRGPTPEITVREDAPESLRVTMLEAAVQLEWSPSSLRDIVCRVLRVRPDPANWSEYPNIWSEVEGLVYGAAWFRIYDIIEAICESMSKADDRHYQTDDGRVSQRFANEINACLFDEGIGWQLVDGLIVTRCAATIKTAA